MLRNVVFDFDGTLVDTAPLIVATMQASIAELGLPPRSAEECRATIGLRLEDVPSALWADREGLGEEYAATYRRLFERLKREHPVRCYPWVLETLRALHDAGFGMAIASSRNSSSLADYAREFGITELFSMMVGGDDVAHGKPAPEPVEKICAELGWKAEETLVVGDAVFDVLMGRNAGARTCAVTYGNQSREELADALPDYLADTFAAVLPIACGVDADLVDYVEARILPRYDAFDGAHRQDHARTVIAQSLKLARQFNEADTDMAYVVAAFHDLGLAHGRERHHLDSARIMREDEFLSRRFSPEQISLMAEAAEDHRASSKHAPRSLYGLIVAEADRLIDADTIMRRTIQYGLANYPELDREGQYQRAAEHLREKYGHGGYLRIWIEGSDNARRLEALRAIIADPASLRALFNRHYLT